MILVVSLINNHKYRKMIVVLVAVMGGTSMLMLGMPMVVDVYAAKSFVSYKELKAPKTSEDGYRVEILDIIIGHTLMLPEKVPVSVILKNTSENNEIAHVRLFVNGDNDPKVINDIPVNKTKIVDLGYFSPEDLVFDIVVKPPEKSDNPDGILHSVKYAFPDNSMTFHVDSQADVDNLTFDRNTLSPNDYLHLETIPDKCEFVEITPNNLTVDEIESDHYVIVSNESWNTEDVIISCFVNVGPHDAFGFSPKDYHVYVTSSEKGTIPPLDRTGDYMIAYIAGVMGSITASVVLLVAKHIYNKRTVPGSKFDRKETEEIIQNG